MKNIKVAILIIGLIVLATDALAETCVWRNPGETWKVGNDLVESVYESEDQVIVVLETNLDDKICSARPVDDMKFNVACRGNTLYTNIINYGRAVKPSEVTERIQICFVLASKNPSTTTEKKSLYRPTPPKERKVVDPQGLRFK